MYRREHWLHGDTTPYNFFVDRETNCSDCIHWPVCNYDVEKRCGNYDFGTTEFKGCSSCLHHSKRYDTPTRFGHVGKAAIPCFFCPWFLDTKRVKRGVILV